MKDSLVQELVLDDPDQCNDLLGDAYLLLVEVYDNVSWTDLEKSLPKLEPDEKFVRINVRIQSESVRRRLLSINEFQASLYNMAGRNSLPVPHVRCWLRYFGPFSHAFPGDDLVEFIRNAREEKKQCHKAEDIMDEDAAG